MEETAKKEISLTIILTEEGHVKVDGPILDEPLSLWMLEKAKDSIKAFNIKRAMDNMPRIQKPTNRIINFVRGK